MTLGNAGSLSNFVGTSASSRPASQTTEFYELGLRTLNFAYTLTALCEIRSCRDVAGLRDTAGLTWHSATKE